MRNVRTTTRWLATPRRTRLGSLFSAKRLFRAAARRSPSSTSPSRKAPGSSGWMAERATEVAPLEPVTSVAAMLPASMSRPAMPASFFFLRLSCRFGLAKLVRIGSSHRQKGRRPFALQLPISRRTWTVLREGAQVPVDDRRAGEQADNAAQRQEGTEGNRLLAGRGAMPGDRRQSDQRAREQGDEQRRAYVATEEEAHHGGQLDVAEAHPARIG